VLGRSPRFNLGRRACLGRERPQLCLFHHRQTFKCDVASSFPNQRRLRHGNLCVLLPVKRKGCHNEFGVMGDAPIQPGTGATPAGFSENRVPRFAELDSQIQRRRDRRYLRERPPRASGPAARVGEQPTQSVIRCSNSQ
jgi:hypothetical protein